MIFDRIKNKIQYPKLVLLLMSIFASYFLFRADIFLVVSEKLNSHGYMAIFLSGFLFAYGFTAPLAVGAFVALSSEVNILLAAALAGFGALIADFLIFKYIKTTFQDEFDRLKLTNIIKRIRYLFDTYLSLNIKKYFLWTIAGILIASPMPDEFGVSLISGFTQIDKRVFALISFLLNTIGILIIFSFARSG